MGVVMEIFVKYPGVELELRPLMCAFRFRFPDLVFVI
jgi:hypothetical protein